MRSTKIAPLACLLVFVAAAVGCSKHASTRARPASPSASTDSRQLAIQFRPVLHVVYRSSAAWNDTALTCPPRDKLIQCIADTLDRDRIVLVAAESLGGDKYVLGPVLIDGSDALRATATEPDGNVGWAVNFSLSPEATERFAAATVNAVGQQIAMIVDGEVVSAPNVQAPIASGSIRIVGSFDEERAKALAAQLNGTA
jgi:preprotein translocase subunit SecD